MSVHVTPADAGLPPTLLRGLLLFTIAIDLLLIAGRVMLYSSILAQPGALLPVLEPVMLLLLYGAITIGITSTTTSEYRVALHHGSTIGLLTGILWIVNLALETFAELSGLGIASTAPLLLGAFVLWSVAGFRTARRTGSAGFGIVAAIWSAMICVLLTVTFGVLLTYTSLPRLEQSLVSDPDYLRSHWHDLRAFAIANTFDSAFSHLLGGLIVGTIVGGVGGLIGRLFSVSSQRG